MPYYYDKLTDKFVFIDCDGGGNLDPTKINNIDKSAQATWAETEDADWYYQLLAAQWTAGNPTLLPLEEYIVAYWKGEDLTDSVGAHTLTNVGASTFTAGKHNNAFTLNGTNQYFSSVSSPDFDFGGDEFTISEWIYIDSLNANMGCFENGEMGSDNGMLIRCDSTNGLFFRVFNNAYNSGNGALALTQGNTTGLTLNTWLHVVVSRVGDKWDLYLNGTSLDDVTSSVSINAYAEDQYIGKAYNNSGTDFDGKIDEVMIMKEHGMTQAEVTALYNSGTGAFRI